MSVEKRDQTIAEAATEFRAACDVLFPPIHDRVRAFVDRHPLVSLFALPIVLIGMGIAYAVQGQYIEGGLTGAAVVYLTFPRRAKN